MGVLSMFFSLWIRDEVGPRRADSVVGIITAISMGIIFVTSPLLLITLGLFLLVINAALLMLTSWVCAQMGVPWGVDGFWDAVLGALFVSTVSFILNSVVGRRGEVHN